MKKTIYLALAIIAGSLMCMPAYGGDREVSPIENSPYFQYYDSDRNVTYICDKEGNRLSDIEFFSIEAAGGYLIGCSKSNYCSIFDSSFQPRIEAKYTYIRYNENTSVFECYYQTENNGIYYIDFYDINLNSVSQPKDISPIEGTQYYVHRVIDENNANNEFLYICNKDGSRLIQEGFRWVNSDSNGNITATCYYNYHQRIYNSDLKPFSDKDYRDIYYDDVSGIYTLVYEKDGAEVTEYADKELKPCNGVRRFEDSMYFYIENEDKTLSICDEKGEPLTDTKYYYITSLGNGFLAVRSSNKMPYKFGILDENLNTAVEEKYYNILSSSDGNIICYTNDSKDTYNYRLTKLFTEKSGYVFWSPVEGVEGRYLYNIDPFDVMPNNNYYIADSNGNCLAGPFSQVKYEKGVYIVSSRAGISDQWSGALNSDFEEIVPIGMTAATFIEKNGRVCVQTGYEEGNYTYYDLKGNKYKSEKEALNALKAVSSMSSWARESIENAIKAGIVPENLQSGYQSSITRQEFCQLALQAYMAKTGYELDKNAENPFDDVNDPYVTNAYNLKIVAGTAYGQFSPDKIITRQEAAVMLNNLAGLMNIAPTAKRNSFIDEGYFAKWAKEAIYSISSIKSGDIYVMTGTDKNKFSPWMTYTREQAIATVLRLYNVR